MTIYDPGTPLPQDIPADSQDDFLLNFQALNSIFGVNHIPFGNSIETATSANPCVISATNHRLVTGNNITVQGMAGLNTEGVQTDWSINGNNYNVTVIDANNFSIPVDTSSEPDYVADTGNFLCNTAGYGYGFHTKIYFPQGTSAPNKAAPYSALYTKEKTYQLIPNITPELKDVFLYFQNQQNVEFQLCGYNLTFENGPGYGLRTPWNLILNFGQSHFANTTNKIITLPISYTTHLAAIVTLRPSDTLTSTAELKVSATTPTNFTVTRSGNDNKNGRYFYWLSVGI